MTQIEKLPIPTDRETAYNQFTFINTLARKGEAEQMKSLVDKYPEHFTPIVFHKAMEKALANAQVDSILFLMDYVDIVTVHYLLCFIDDDELTDDHLYIMDILYYKKPEFLAQARELNKLGKYKALEQIINFIDVFKVREKINEEITRKEAVIGIGDRISKI